jgi:hypothetical protein
VVSLQVENVRKMSDENVDEVEEKKGNASLIYSFSRLINNSLDNRRRPGRIVGRATQLGRTPQEGQKAVVVQAPDAVRAGGFQPGKKRRVCGG